MSFGVHWVVYHRQCIIRQQSIQAERPLVVVFSVKIIEPNPIGCIPNHRTTDHLIVLKTVCDLFKSSHKHVYISMFHRPTKGIWYSLAEKDCFLKCKNPN